MKKLLLALSVTLLLFSSCEKEGQKTAYDLVFDINLTSMKAGVPVNGGTYDINVSSTNAWHVNGELNKTQSSFSQHKSGFSSDDVVTVKLHSNDVYDKVSVQCRTVSGNVLFSGEVKGVDENKTITYTLKRN